MKKAETAEFQPIEISLPENLVTKIEEWRARGKSEKERIDREVNSSISLLLSGFLTGQNGAGEKQYRLSLDGRKLIEIIEDV